MSYCYCLWDAPSPELVEQLQRTDVANPVAYPVESAHPVADSVDAAHRVAASQAPLAKQEADHPEAPRASLAEERLRNPTARNLAKPSGGPPGG